MDTMECIRKRRSVRSFAGKEVPQEVIDRILDAGRLSPSAMNLQPWHFVVVRSRDRLRELGNYCLSGRFVSGANFAVAVLTDPSNKWHEIDGARAVQNMSLAAWNEGVGTCWVGAIDRDRVRGLLGVPERWHVLTVLPFGYPAGAGIGGKRKKPLEDIVSNESYGNGG